jgi:hypothetical protein
MLQYNVLLFYLPALYMNIKISKTHIPLAKGWFELSKLFYQWKICKIISRPLEPNFEAPSFRKSRRAKQKLTKWLNSFKVRLRKGNFCPQ